MNKKTIFITGITGQDGSYLAKLLLSHSYNIIGLVRDKEYIDLSKLNYLDIASDVTIEKCDLCNIEHIKKLIIKYSPSAIYNFAAQSSVGESFKNPFETINFNTTSVLNILESIKDIDKNIRFYQASSSEMFGSVNELPINEESTLYPVSPYGISKASAHWICRNYRESYGLYATSGILFNHESVLRGDNFVIKKIISTALDIKAGKKDVLEVGNIEIKRDFGYAPKYVEAMYLMMQQEIPDDYIICSGKSISLKKIIWYIFDKLEISRDKIIINQDLYRPNEIRDIYGDPSKAKTKLKWEYDIDFFAVIDELITMEQV
jgi:GDPmannose 4,6-dehydratase